MSQCTRPKKHRFEMIGNALLLRTCRFFFQWNQSFLGVRSIVARHRAIAENSWTLFDTIAETCGVTHVVDSSKCPVRMNLLHKARSFDMSVILLVRDVRGVANSGRRRGKYPVAIARQWSRFYRYTLKLLKYLGLRWLLVRYEDYSRDPLRERQRIATFIGKGNTNSRLEIDTHKHHIVGGAAMRYKGKLLIQPNEDWRNELSNDLEQSILKEAEELLRKYPFLRHS